MLKIFLKNKEHYQKLYELQKKHDDEMAILDLQIAKKSLLLFKEKQDPTHVTVALKNSEEVLLNDSSFKLGYYHSYNDLVISLSSWANAFAVDKGYSEYNLAPVLSRALISHGKWCLPNLVYHSIIFYKGK